MLKTLFIALFLAWFSLGNSIAAALSLSVSTNSDDFILYNGDKVIPIILETNSDRAVARATQDLAEDFARVTDFTPEIHTLKNHHSNLAIVIGTLGKNALLDQLIAAKKLDTNLISGQWESFGLQLVNQPWPGVDRALVIFGSDRRGTIFGIYQLSEIIGVSPWYWWADVPVKTQKRLALQGESFFQPPPAVKFRGIFLNDEDWGLRPWAAKTFEPETGNIGPKTYARIFELLLRLHANCLWPAMHPGTAAFNSFATNREIANDYGIVMGASHCEQMLRNNVSEWDEKEFGEYNFVTNPNGVLKYWEQRVRENGVFENIYTLGMRGIHDGGMPGGGSAREKATRLQEIIRDQRDLLMRWVNPQITEIPQIFCPYKEVLELYRLNPNLPDDITLVWPDDNYGYIRQFSNARERLRLGGSGVYYHVSYWGKPRDYLWLCTTPPALIAEEMTKAYDCGANQFWMLNVGDLKPAELDLEFFLKLAWNPHAWNGTNTYQLFGKQLERDFGTDLGSQITPLLAEFYRLNFQRKPEHLNFPTNNLFTSEEAIARLDSWKNLAVKVENLSTNLPISAQASFFELISYPVQAAAAMNEKCLAASTNATAEIELLTTHYNQETANGKWRFMMSANPHNQINSATPTTAPALHFAQTNYVLGAANNLTTNFFEQNQTVILLAAHASKFISGTDAHWSVINGLGYQGIAASPFPVTATSCDTPEKIIAHSPSLNFLIEFATAGDWKFTVRTLPTFSVIAGQPQRYALSLDDAPPQIVALPVSASEENHLWQENVLRNAAFTTQTLTVKNAGKHKLKLWMVDPGIVVDAIAAEIGATKNLGYVWPAETLFQPETTSGL